MHPDVSKGAAGGACVGVVIAGGRSVRFGGEKAVAMLSGEPLLMWAVRRLQRTCAAVAVNARPQTQAEVLGRRNGLPVLHDVHGDPLGPLAGVKVGLQWARELGAQAIAVSPCDAPLLPDDLFPRLIEAADGGAAMAETPEGVQPLCAVWPVSALPRVTEALIGGRHPPTWVLLEQCGARRVSFGDPEAFANINTPADLTTLSRRFHADAARGMRDDL
jgi:molybdenum cofactor guanylyltransferase